MGKRRKYNIQKKLKRPAPDISPDDAMINSEPQHTRPPTPTCTTVKIKAKEKTKRSLNTNKKTISLLDIATDEDKKNPVLNDVQSAGNSSMFYKCLVCTSFFQNEVLIAAHLMKKHDINILTRTDVGLTQERLILPVATDLWLLEEMTRTTARINVTPIKPPEKSDKRCINRKPKKEKAKIPSLSKKKLCSTCRCRRLDCTCENPHPHPPESQPQEKQDLKPKKTKITKEKSSFNSVENNHLVEVDVDNPSAICNTVIPHIRTSKIEIESDHVKSECDTETFGRKVATITPSGRRINVCVLLRNNSLSASERPEMELPHPRCPSPSIVTLISTEIGLSPSPSIVTLSTGISHHNYNHNDSPSQSDSLSVYASVEIQERKCTCCDDLYSNLKKHLFVRGSSVKCLGYDLGEVPSTGLILKDNEAGVFEFDCELCDVRSFSLKSLIDHSYQTHGLLEDGYCKEVIIIVPGDKTEAKQDADVEYKHAPSIPPLPPLPHDDISNPSVTIFPSASPKKSKKRISKEYFLWPENPRGKFSCRYCDKTLRSIFSFEKHCRTVHEVGKDILKSLLCEMMEESRLRAKIGKSGTPEPMVKCECCGRKIRKSQLLRHMLMEAMQKANEALMGKKDSVLRESDEKSFDEENSPKNFLDEC